MFSSGFRIVLFFALVLLATDGWAAGRAIRVDNPSNWNTSSIGSAACTGTTSGSTLITSFSYTFSGRATTATENYGTNAYCEVALSGTLNRFDYFHDDENGLRALLAGGVGVTAMRYDFLDNNAVFSADGFQWGFFTFPVAPHPVTLVTLYGLDGSINGIVPDGTSYIKNANRTIWSGSNGYNGQYYCFQNNAFVGLWNGTSLDANNVCLRALGVVFIDGFDGS